MKWTKGISISQRLLGTLTVLSGANVPHPHIHGRERQEGTCSGKFVGHWRPPETLQQPTRPTVPALKRSAIQSPSTADLTATSKHYLYKVLSPYKLALDTFMDARGLVSFRTLWWSSYSGRHLITSGSVTSLQQIENACQYKSRPVTILTSIPNLMSNFYEDPQVDVPTYRSAKSWLLSLSRSTP